MKGGWIESAAYDLPLVALAPLIGIVIAGVAWMAGEQTLLARHFVELNLFFVGMPHYLSTYSFFFDDENVEHYRQRRIAFYAGPVLVLALMTAAFALHFFILVAGVVALWNVFHVSRQSAGILSTYRHIGRGRNEIEKWPSNIALIATSYGLFLYNASHAEGNPAARSIARPEVLWISIVLMAAGAAALVVLAWRMSKRRAGAPEWIFLASSIGLFLPYVLINDLVLATTAMLSGHYVQYLGLVWLLNRRKYRNASGSAAQRILATLSQSLPLLLVTLALLAVVPFGIDRVVHRMSFNAFHAWALNAVVLLHFYFDGLVWAFKDPYTRRSIAPYLTGYSTDPRVAHVEAAVNAA